MQYAEDIKYLTLQHVSARILCRASAQIGDHLEVEYFSFRSEKRKKDSH